MWSARSVSTTMTMTSGRRSKTPQPAATPTAARSRATGRARTLLHVAERSQLVQEPRRLLGRRRRRRRGAPRGEERGEVGVGLGRGAVVVLARIAREVVELDVSQRG